MNDNLRYISLQYIKGDNYEEITCFKYDVINDILKNTAEFRKDISANTLNQLKDAIDDERCYIGESFLNDLVNYYNFKDIKRKIEVVKKIISEYKNKLDSNDNNDNLEIIKQRKNRTEIIRGIKDFVDILKRLDNDKIGEQLGKGIEPKEDETEEPAAKAVIKYNNVLGLLNSHSFDSSNSDNTLLDDLVSVSPQGAGEGDKGEPYDKVIKRVIDKITNVSSENPPNLQLVKNAIVEGINTIIKHPNGQKYDIIKLLLTLRKLLLYAADQDSLTSQSEIMNVENLLSLFKTYTKICNSNIGKFDKIFQQNDISNIDEAFMIESYSSFLKKLNKLKENLESKDQGKLERLLTNSLEKLFNLYGINDYDKIINGDNISTNDGDPIQKYFKKIILDY
jgi:hypothetical protein